MQQQQQPQKPVMQEWSENVNAFIGVCQIVSRLVEVFLRIPGSWGERFAGFQMAASWVFAFCWPMFFQGEDPRPMWWLWLAATAMLLVHRFVGIIRRTWGYVCHSFYGGDSLVGRRERELVPLLIATIVAFTANRPLGMYLLLATICFCVSVAWQRASENAKIRALRDARFDQEWLMNQQGR